LRALALLNNFEFPALEDGCANRRLLVRLPSSLSTTSTALLTWNTPRSKRTKKPVPYLTPTHPRGPGPFHRPGIQGRYRHRLAAESISEREKYVVPPHLCILQEADLPETQRGLVISEITQFRERAAKQKSEKMWEQQQQPGVPSGLKMREWGDSRGSSRSSRGSSRRRCATRAWVRTCRGTTSLCASSVSRSGCTRSWARSSRQSARRVAGVRCCFVMCFVPFVFVVL
jgi:RNA-binding protein 25